MAVKKSVTVSNPKLVPGDITVSDLSKTGRNPRADARLLQIANVAAALFFEKGYVQTTTRDIGKACGISPGHLYYYINSKDDLPAMFAEIHKKDTDKWEKQIRKDMKTLPTGGIIKESCPATCLSYSSEAQDGGLLVPCVPASQR